MGENYPLISLYDYHNTLWGQLLLWIFIGSPLVCAYLSYLVKTKLKHRTAIGSTPFSDTNQHFNQIANTNHYEKIFTLLFICYMFSIYF